MNILSRLKNVYKIGLAFGLFAVAISGTNLIANRISPAAAVNACKTINVIYCGISGTTTTAQISSLKNYYNGNTSGHSPAIKDIKTIFNYMGASQALIDGMDTSNTISGYVLNDGRVIRADTGAVIATNAYSVGRFNTPNSIPVPGTSKVWVRPTSDSFASQSLAAIIRLDSNGNMIFASILECGNPVKATPVITPKVVIPTVTTPVIPVVPDRSYIIVKEVALAGTTNFAPSITVNYGTRVIYRITVTATGDTPVKSLGVYDILPSGIQYVKYTIKQDGSGYSESFFSSGKRITSLPNGTSTNFSFEAIVGPNDTATSCTPETIRNTADTSIMAVMQPDKSSTATVTKTCIPPVVVPKPTVVTPTYACVSLSASSISRTNFNYTVTATAANGATVKAYNFNFGDGATQSVATNGLTTMLQHAYSTPGSYNSTVSVTVTLPGSPDSSVTSTGCATTINVTQIPATALPAAAECIDLKLLQANGNPRDVTATVTYSVSNGASLSGVSFNWNDGNVTSNGVTTSAQHTYAANGTYIIAATLSFSSGSTALPQSTCQKSITINVVPPVVPPVVATCTNLTLFTSTLNPRLVTATVAYTASSGVALNSVNFTWNDGFVTVNGVAVSAQHTYAANGTYNIVASLGFSSGSVALPNVTCQGTVTFTAIAAPVVAAIVPVVPTVLPNTGPGSVVALFAGVSAIGTFGYRLFQGRRLVL